MAVLTRLLDQGVLSPFATATLDASLNLRRQHVSSEIVVITIDESDYSALFQRECPLGVTQVQRLVDAIAKGRPSLIGIDLDTSDRRFQGLRVRREWPPTVWAEEAIYGEDCRCFEPQPPLGGRDPSPLSGASTLILGADGVVRKYQRLYPTTRGNVRSFALQICLSYPPRNERCRETSSGQQLILDFAGVDIPHYHARDVLQAAEGAGWPGGPLAGKIVVVGGSYRAARDEYRTPFGAKSGVDLSALAIDTELRGSGTTEVLKSVMESVEVLLGVVIIWLGCRWTSPLVLLLSLAVITACLFFTSVWLFSVADYWLNAIPLLAAVSIHQLYEHFRHYRNLYREAWQHQATSAAVRLSDPASNSPAFPENDS